MEFKLISLKEVCFPYGRSNCRKSTRKKVVVSITKTHSCRSKLTFDPVLDEEIGADCFGGFDYDHKSCRENTIDLLFGDSDLAKDLKRRALVPLTTHLTLTPSKDGRLKIQAPKDKDVDIFEELHKLEEDLPPDSLEFSLTVDNFENVATKEKRYFDGTGLKLTQDKRSGSVSLELTDIRFPKSTWKEWSDGQVTFLGWLKLNLKLDMAAVIELYKMRLGKGPLATELGVAEPDLVIFVGGNKDKEKAIKCHKSILSEMSPVFEAMFQADMVEAKEGTLEIVDSSETCIRAFVEFAYRRNVEDALKSSEMALELLKMADKYEMMELMDILQQIIWNMPCTWFSVDMLLKLLFYANTAGEALSQSERKCWVVLKWYAKLHPEMVMASKEYVRLCENPQVMMQLGLLFINNLASDCVII